MVAGTHRAKIRGKLRSPFDEVASLLPIEIRNSWLIQKFDTDIESSTVQRKSVVDPRGAAETSYAWPPLLGAIGFMDSHGEADVIL